ncbi:probable 2-oxoglutarate-dependent dioxygenase SLC1 [Ricinus communis]|uniref:Leucoanthocyanidin dioxygenase, putative n=1 Tax=Ricinus communis TaxID=3988 RepID=B9S0A9_RICCO|nr:probable 2-oxoglutarate-dependent dioxygenase SLC1 [Ricinus communis]EEF42842.1 Leucoanthocyanidin dioxygenase, putative [Ricinus communis]|eukprot:XP_002519428.1 protein DMR6-LIKE OXYGENASE 2 [Ricinus communis]
MSPSMAIAKANSDDVTEIQYQKGVKRLCETGISRVPDKYILPVQERPNATRAEPSEFSQNLKLPIIDFAELQGSNRPQVLKSIANACEQYGFFQLVNHGIPNDVISGMIDAAKRFFELPYEERLKYMSSDMNVLVRYGTSFNQNKDNVFCWRDFLKLMCHPLSDVLPHWPSSPTDFRKLAATYAKESKYLFLMVMVAILESLLGTNKNNKTGEDEIMKDFQDGNQLMVVNFYPECPEPELTLGMPPHSDYGFLTLLLQDEVEGLQIHYKEKWVTVEPIPNAFVINVGDHLEIFSNGKYKSVLHRVKVNSAKSRISVASLHTLPFMCMVRPWPKLIDEANPRRYEDTNFASFLEYISSREPKNKEFLDSRKLISRNSNP